MLDIIRNNLVILPVVLAILCAAICVFISNKRISYFIFFLFCTTCLFLSYELFVKVLEEKEIRYVFGGFKAPYGIEYRVDYLSAIFLLVLSFIFFALSFCAFNFTAEEILAKKTTSFYTLCLLLYAGLSGIILSNDIFNIFVFIEISSLATYSLISFGNNKKSLIASYDYLILGTIGATFIVIGVGYIYISTGTLNIDDIQAKLILLNDFRSIIVGSAFLLLGIMLKMAIFPFHMWLVRAYNNSPSLISCLLAAIATKVSIYLLIRFSFFIFGINFSFTFLGFEKVLLILAIASIIVGNISAIFNSDSKRILAFSSVANIGVIILAISLANSYIFAVSIVFLISHSLAKALVFCAVGDIFAKTKSTNISSFENINPTSIVALALIVGTFSLVGIPITFGFVSKLYLFNELFAQKYYSILAFLILFSFVSLMYAYKIISPFFRNTKQQYSEIKTKLPTKISLIILIFANIYFGFFSNDLISFAENLSDQIFSNNKIILPRFL